MTVAIDLPEADMAIVRDLLRRHLPPGCQAFVFGSRATGSARRYSDLDLAIEANRPLGFAVLGSLAEALSESDLPIKVDVLDLRAADPAFRALIAPDLVPLAF